MASSAFVDEALLDRYVFRRDDDSFPSDERTEASGMNSRGDKIRVCLELHEPPRPSHLYLWWPEGTGLCDRFSVVAAHRCAVLLQMSYPIPVPNRDYPYDMNDYFLYRPGEYSWLQRLPSVQGTMDEFRALFKDGSFRYTNQHLRRIDGLDIGVLCRDDGEIAVAELQIMRTEEPELHLLFTKRKRKVEKPLRKVVPKLIEWQIKKPQIIRGPELDLERFLYNWSADKVISFGEYICWVDYCQGAILLCKVFDDNPKIQYLALPAKVPGLDRDIHGRLLAERYMTLGVNECGILKFVIVSGDDASFQPRKLAFNFTTSSWTLKVTENNELFWDCDACVRSEDLWAHDKFAQLPRAPLEYPQVSMKDPSAVYFVLRKKGARLKLDKMVFHSDETWLLAFDMANMAIKSSYQYIKGKEEKLSSEEAQFIDVKYRYFETFLSIQLKMLSGDKQFQGSSFLDMAFGPCARKRKHGSALISCADVATQTL